LRADGAPLTASTSIRGPFDEANWTYRQFGISGYAGQGSIARAPIRGARARDSRCVLDQRAR
jgi:hypothetical protein